MITEERLQELVSCGREAMPFKAELQELVEAYRAKKARVILNSNGLEVNKGTDGAWMCFRAPNGNQAAISIEVLAAKHSSIIAKTVRDWADAL